MNKLPLIGLTVVASAVVLAGCGAKKPPVEVTPAVTGEPTVTQELSEWQKIGTARASGQTAQCLMTNSQTGEVTQYTIKGKSMRFDNLNATNSAQMTSFLTDGEYVYTWNEGTKRGVKLSALAPSITPGAKITPPPQAPDFSTEEAWQNYQNLGYTINCSIQPVDDALFIPPTDVKFTDMSALTKQMQKVTPAATGAGKLDEAQIKEMLKQYGGTEE